jgi:hypothetical protein
MHEFAVLAAFVGQQKLAVGSVHATLGLVGEHDTACVTVYRKYGTR